MRRLLTDGAKVSFTKFADAYHCRDFDETEVLTETKEWRGDLWRQFAEIERRLCPQPESKTNET